MLAGRPALLALASGQWRAYSSSGDAVISEMISYARQNFRTNPEQAIDILKGGLGFKSTGPDAGRLYLAQAEVESDRNRWGEVAELARRAATAASDSSPSSPEEALLIAEVELTAECISARASLAQGRDAEAYISAQQCMDVARKSFSVKGLEDRRWQGLALGTSVAGLVQHAAGDFEAAQESFDSVVALANHQDARQGPPPDRDHMIPDALKQAALFRLSSGENEESSALALRAISGAKQAAAAAKGSTGVMQSELLAAEVVADAHLAAAQVSFDEQDWDAAEKLVEQAIATAEGASGANRQRISIPLLMLGKVYSRSGRVTLAEGLYRECAKMLGLDPAKPDDASLTAVHPSVGALLAWRFGQLLTALPQRGTEAGRWAGLARTLFDERPVGRATAPEAVFGTLDNLTGRGDAGRGIVVDLMSRRVLPRQLTAPPQAPE